MQLLFCEFSGLLVGGTLLQHKDIHMRTSPGGITKTELDHKLIIVIINKKWRSLQCVRVYTCADYESSHKLVVGEIKNVTEDEKEEGSTI